jgi:MRG-binding protein
MISIRQHLLSSGLIDPDDAHTSIPGIWRKLGEWYDLAALDEREDAIVSDDNENGEDGDEGGGGEYWRDFELPSGEFEEMMWSRRLATESNVGSSPPATSLNEPIGNEPQIRRRESTIADSDDPRSSPISTSGLRSSRRGAGPVTRGGRVNKLIADEAETGSGGRSRRSSKATTAAEPEDEEMEDVDEDGESGDEESEDGDEEDEKRGSARKRGRGGNRGRGRKRR